MEADVPTVLAASYLSSGHIRQRAVHFFALQRSASSVVIAGIIDDVTDDADVHHITTLLESQAKFASAEFVIIPDIEEAFAFFDFARLPRYRFVHLQSHRISSHDSRNELLRCLPALIDYIPLLVPLMTPSIRQASDVLFRDLVAPDAVISDRPISVIHCRNPDRSLFETAYRSGRSLLSLVDLSRLDKEAEALEAQLFSEIMR